MQRRNLVILAAALLIAGRTQGAQSEAASESRSKAAEELVSPIHKGVSRLGVFVAAGSTLSPQGSIGHRPSVELAAHWGRIVSEPRGPGFLEGNLEIGLDVAPLFLVLNGEAAYGAHAALSFRHYLNPASRVRPFVTLRSGPLVTNHQVPEKTSRFNFASSVELGVLLPSSGRLWYSVDLAFQHISNADTSPHNPGMNSVRVQFAVSCFR